MAAPSPLPAVPAYELDSKIGSMSGVKLITSAPGVADVYALPASYCNDDLCRPHDPPASLGNFYPKQKTP
jgi:hypothetical protein